MFVCLENQLEFTLYCNFGDDQNENGSHASCCRAFWIGNSHILAIFALNFTFVRLDGCTAIVTHQNDLFGHAGQLDGFYFNIGLSVGYEIWSPWPPSSKSHNTLHKFPTMHHCVAEMYTGVIFCCKMVGYGTNALWDLWNRLVSITLLWLVGWSNYMLGLP